MAWGGDEGEGGTRETWRERGKRGVARLCVFGCACVWMRGGGGGKGGNRVRYVMHYKIRSCTVAIALIIITVPVDGT